MDKSPNASDWLSYDKGRGLFFWKKARPGVTAGTIAGSVNGHGYVQICFFRKLIQAHRLAFFIVCGEWPAEEVDHINGRRSDNRWVNLRLASKSLNMRNKTLSVKSQSGAIGVYRQGNRWRAKIGSEHIGYFRNLDEAINARRDEEKRRGYHHRVTP